MMKNISNAFALLDLDVEDNTEEIVYKPRQKDGNCSVDSGKCKQQSSNMDPITSRKKKKQDRQELLEPSECYKWPLVWIDLEMTGLNLEVDRILEIACIITDGKLTKVLEGPDFIIYQSKECLENMGEWCQKQHAASGLTAKVLQSTINEQDAEKQVIEFIKKNVGTYQPVLAGNSVYVDFSYLKKYMPTLAGLFSHVLIDVSSVKALCLRWYPKEFRKAPAKKNTHRAMDDIKESIQELKYLKDAIFKGSKK
ncbi:oligoribonuclease isoform X1 [Amborella trichopoda]|uniref:oligoribonuclease isoform X1 n=1 Tax=Amborella trichopoda TaxID=13333 RepID=UPI0009BEC68A|nr:oligoribonuclease isoform X1 [Amborella trichopoda]XP_020517158.1 oligoribonuclease isoform X1 [Amborella trichopoda]XP_020517159.1 oligoribonuclease isoform X1 [Amborella trichopoda]|eukprot:XP_020517157.1 oligoribonuclease isoform X1 [Amborella trichopoda]